MAEARLHWKSTATHGQRMASASKDEFKHFHSVYTKRSKMLNLRYFCMSFTSFYLVLYNMSGSMIELMAVMMVAGPGKVPVFSKGQAH